MAVLHASRSGQRNQLPVLRPSRLTILRSFCLGLLLGCCSCSFPRDKSSVILLDLADTTCEHDSMIAGRPEALETKCRIGDSELESVFNTAFHTEAGCSGLQVSRLESERKTVAAFTLQIYVWRGTDGAAPPVWNWSMNGSTFAGKSANVTDTVRNVCRVMKGAGGSVVG
jgi:hypothetical protein